MLFFIGVVLGVIGGGVIVLGLTYLAMMYAIAKGLNW